MNSLGLEHTDEDIQNVVKKFITKVRGKDQAQINFDDFCSIMALYERDPDVEEEELMEMFMVFDPDNVGRIDMEQFKEVMHRLGEELSDA
mgnify:CR=1 FL=1